MDPGAVLRPPSGEPTDENIGPSVALGLALVAQLAEERGIEPTLLANRADVHALAAGRRTGRLSSGWRFTVAGEPLRALFAGEAALTADGNGGVVLVEPGKPRRPASEEMATMRPRPLATRWGVAAWMARNAPLRLMSIIASHCSSVSSWAKP